ncbi:hypothetical protein [Clostridium sp. OS1-26]|uniref:hypothetical protein n=1 Tax=Clostridium sp. OS1-26 TaxID=3070681 RepID=UPI0027E085CE|nr:hypothetical protein [Clostridium sp. OS1-26]WML34501.1 hypothetical protein RCG18_25000 [Clostridium sp. OS1-26]
MKIKIIAPLLITSAMLLQNTLVFADSLPGITSTKNIYLYNEGNRLTDNKTYSKKTCNETSNIVSVGSVHDITIHEPTLVSNLNLPSNILVTTTEGTMLVPLQWSNYSGVSINTTTQLSGKIVLPPSILNTTSIKLNVTQTVKYEGTGLQSNLGTVRDNKIVNIPPATTIKELIGNLSYNGAKLTDKMSAIVVDRHNERVYDGIVNDGDSLQISDGLYTHTYYFSIIRKAPSNSSSLLSIIPPQPIAVPVADVANSLNLPSIMRIDTTNGTVNLPVQWNIPKDLSITEDVQISGTIVLPDNIYNLGGVELPVYQQLNYKPLRIPSSFGFMAGNFIDIPVGTSVSSLIDAFTNADSYTLTFHDKNHNTLGSDANIVTGDILVVTSGNTNYNFYLSTKTAIMP